MQQPSRTLSKLIVSLVMTLSACLVVLQGTYGQEAANTGLSSIQDIDFSVWQTSYSENQKLVVLFYQPDACDKCTIAMDSLTQVVGQPEVPTDLVIAKSSNPDLVSHVGVHQFPSLVLLKAKSHVTYDGNFGVEDILEWIQLATNQVTHTLDDGSFEHLTQAATGATTGDWLVAFYKDSCKNILPVMDTFSVRVHGRVNVAKVNILDSPSLVNRFKISNCPELIFFKQGKMYKYTLPNMDAASFRSFVDGFYKNVQAQIVPLPKSQFDFLTESIADYIKIQLEGENKSFVLAGLCGAVLSLLTVIFCCCRSAVGETKEKKEMRK